MPIAMRSDEYPLQSLRPGQRVLVMLQRIPQGRQMSLDDRVKRGVLRPMALVAAP